MILKVLAIALLFRSTECSFLMADSNSLNQTFVYYSPVGSVVNHTIAHHICAGVGGSLVTMQTDQEIMVAPEFFKTTVWLSYAPVLNIPDSSAPQFRYSWPDGEPIDPVLWSNTPAVSLEDADEPGTGHNEPGHHDICKGLIYDQSIRALNELYCNKKSAVVCKTEIDPKQTDKIQKLLPDQETNQMFEPLPSKVGKLVSILSRTDEGPTPEQISKAANVMKKANVALEERQKIKMMNQLIEAHNHRTTSALTLGYVALGFAFAVVLLLVLVVAGTLIRKPDIRVITMSASRRKSGYPNRSESVNMSKPSGKDLELSALGTQVSRDQSIV